MPSRMGRPIKGESRRDQSLQIRMSKPELNLLDECSQKLRISRTDVINKGISLIKESLDVEEAQKQK